MNWLVEKTDEDKGLDLDVNGQQLTVKVGSDGLASGDSFTVRYGNDAFPAYIQHKATADVDEDDNGVSIRAYFRASEGLRQRDAGVIWVDVTNVEDGAGTATLTTGPSITRAGSKDNLITVVYTGAGTMDGGAVSLERPEGWGLMQNDPLKLNYVRVVVSSRASLAAEDPITFEEGDKTDGAERVVVTLKTFAKDDTLTFFYGDGSGGAGNKGAEAQDDIADPDINGSTGAFFTIRSAGSANGVPENIEGVKALGDPSRIGSSGESLHH